MNTSIFKYGRTWSIGRESAMLDVRHCVLVCVMLTRAFGTNTCMEERVKDTKLLGHMFLVLEAPREETCFQVCLRSSRCLSVNWEAAVRRCELNSVSGQHNDRVNVSGAVYMQVNMPSCQVLGHVCGHRSCDPTEFCVTVRGGAGYLCVTTDTYQGCYGQANKDRLLPTDDDISSNSMTIPMCSAHCQTLNKPYIALHKGKDCSCGTTLDTGGHSLLADSSCSKACFGDSSTFCGATWKVSVYKNE
ncbi:uncharacterized protein LOC124276017 [Haliotis rubra]|uniref:uncharacterized protein LOC124276017 n=1 Tax=Haliotis rubra TaxID=36100 RepID=UPI001EE57A73|nr:uncharacterized protein LOC124276017 [Haliotis rubra]